MFKRLAEFFAGAPAPVQEIKAEDKRCSRCGVPGCQCSVPWQPSEPVLSILNAVKTRRKTFLFMMRDTHEFSVAGTSSTAHVWYGLADTTTGRAVTIHKQTQYRRHSGAKYVWSGHEHLGLDQREVKWLIAMIEQRFVDVQARAAALAGAKARRELMQEYVK